MRLVWCALSLLMGLLVPLTLLGIEPAQKVVRLGFVLPGEPEDASDMKQDVFWNRLRTLGWEEGRNLDVDRRFAQGRKEVFPGFMEDMVQRKVDIIVTTSTPGALAAQRATTTIPIVVHSMGDPVGTALVSSLGHPAGNLTGMSSQLEEGLPGKWLELLQELVPKLSTVAVLSTPNSPLWRTVENKIKGAAQARGLKTIAFRVTVAEEIEGALQQARLHSQAVVVLPDILFIRHREHVATATAKVRLPAIYGWPGFALAGGLMSYSPNAAEGWEQVAVYVDKILRGSNAGDLPIVQYKQFSLAVNLKAAKALGLSIPESILLRAEEVIR